jgi:peptidoglycan/LPS O-acetylase OafA/YrhL
MTTRNINLDIMRLLGLGIIMLAHSFPPDWLFQLRNFGTPLLIIASALTYAYIYSNRELDTKSFLKKRIVRLIVPLYIFLSFFFCFFSIAGVLLGFDTEFDLKKIVFSYLMINGIGFVWIFKVYLMLTILTPISLYIMKSKIKNHWLFFFLASLYILYELIYNLFPWGGNKYLDDILKYIILLMIPYSLLYIYGMKLNTFTKRRVLLIAFTSFLIFVVGAVYLYLETGSFVPTQEYKYPPRLYYLSYAFFAIHIIYFFIMRLNINSELSNKVILFLSKNSLWIYLWHIFAFYIWQFTFPNLEYGLGLSLLMMVYLFLFGICMSYLQITLIKRLLKTPRSEMVNRFYRVFL